MRKTKEVLRLRFELGLGQRQIARSCGMGLGTVHDYLERAAAAGIAVARRLEAASAAGLEQHSCATATASSSDTAVSMGRIPANAQLVLRALSALAAAPGCGAAP